MTPKISSKFIIESDKSTKTPISNPVKTSTTSSQLTDGLSGTKLGSFGSLSNSTLAKSLKASSASVSEVDEVATGVKTEETSVDETDVSLFTKETSGGASDVNDLDSTLSKLENDDACLDSMNSAIKSARGYLSTANDNIALANKAAESGDFETALSYWQDAQTDIEKARQEAQKAGDTNLQREIQVQAEVCKGQIEWLTSQLNDPLNSIMCSGVGGSCSSGGGSTFASTLGNSLQNGVGNAASNAGQNAVNSLFGNKGNQSAGGTGNAGGAGSAGKSSGTGKTPSSIKSSGSNKSKELQYDRSKGEIKKAVQDSGAETTYNKGTTMIEEANKALPDAKSSLENATNDISLANKEIEKLTETNREYLEEYSETKEKIYQFDTQIEEQAKIEELQNGIIQECDSKLPPLNNKKTTLSENIKTTKLGIQHQKILLSNCTGTDKANAENTLRNLETKLIELEAELTEVENNIKMYEKKKTEAEKKKKEASEEKQKLTTEKETSNKKLAELNKKIDKLHDKEQGLRKRLDQAYDQKTTAQNKISECEQKIIAGETYQDMGEELRDNAIEKVEDSKDTGESKWYTPLLSLFK